MSEGFDKEAERQRLREKYEKDRQKREATQRMSELLLKGATMTNHHCDQCGDPIFRYDGQEFCPTCQTPAETQAEAEAEAQSPNREATSPENATSEADETPAAETGVETEAEAKADARADVETTRTAPATNEPAETRAASARATERTTAESTPAESRPTPTETEAGDVNAARESLVRTLTRFARRAEETDDPRRARESLAAAREAAEALSALER